MPYVAHVFFCTCYDLSGILFNKQDLMGWFTSWADTHLIPHAILGYSQTNSADNCSRHLCV